MDKYQFISNIVSPSFQITIRKNIVAIFLLVVHMHNLFFIIFFILQFHINGRSILHIIPIVWRQIAKIDKLLYIGGEVKKSKNCNSDEMSILEIEGILREFGLGNGQKFIT